MQNWRSLLWIADEPLSQGPKAMHEGVLLGRALLGYEASLTEQRVLLSEAWEGAGIPHRDVTVHVVFRLAGKVTGEMYMSISASGGGRHHGSNRPPIGNFRELVVEEGPTPALDRFLRLHEHLAEQLREAHEI